MNRTFTHNSPTSRNGVEPEVSGPRSAGDSDAGLSKPLSPEGSFIPGETEEDGLLRREYVLVGDTRAIELHRAVDGK